MITIDCTHQLARITSDTLIEEIKTRLQNIITDITPEFDALQRNLDGQETTLRAIANTMDGDLPEGVMNRIR